jgi:UDP-N-acetyl-D-glucosamine dehydrogenase
MPFYVSSMTIKEIAKQPITLDNAKVLLLGMAFKRDVADLRHSPALKVAEILLSEGIKQISYYDPYIPEIRINGFEFKSLSSLNENILSDFDIVVITTDHTVFDFEMIARSSKVVIDTRNALKKFKGVGNVVLLGDGK